LAARRNAHDGKMLAPTCRPHGPVMSKWLEMPVCPDWIIGLKIQVLDLDLQF